MRSKRSRSNPSDRAPDDELDFVDGQLLTLAGQLSAEANALATTFPPKSALLDDPPETTSLRSSRSPRRSYIPWWISTCTAVSVALLLSLWLSPLALPPQEAAIGDRAGRSAGPQPAALPQQTASRPEIGPTAREPMISPVVFVSELSDPEFEAWLDLQRDRGEERIAF